MTARQPDVKTYEAVTEVVGSGRETSKVKEVGISARRMSVEKDKRIVGGVKPMLVHVVLWGVKGTILKE